MLHSTVELSGSGVIGKFILADQTIQEAFSEKVDDGQSELGEVDFNTSVYKVQIRRVRIVIVDWGKYGNVSRGVRGFGSISSWPCAIPVEASCARIPIVTCT